MKIPSEPKCTFVKCITCGGELLVRRRRDDNKPFLGCKNYPTCKGAWDLAQALAYACSAAGNPVDSAATALMLLDANLFYSYFKGPKKHLELLTKVTELIGRYTTGPQQARPKPSGGKTITFITDEES